MNNGPNIAVGDMVLIEAEKVHILTTMAAVGKMCLSTLANMAYQGWAQSTKDSHMMEMLTGMQNSLGTEAEKAIEDGNTMILTALGFNPVEDGPILVPLWFWPMIPDGTELEDIRTHVIFRKGDSEYRRLVTERGVLPYGIPRRRVVTM